MKSPVVYGNPMAFGAVDWNYGATVKRGKSVEELGDAGWARERERMAHLQQLHQLQLRQQQVGYPAYGGVLPVHPHGPVKVASPSSPLPVQGFPMPVPGGMMVPVGGPVHVSAPWPVQWGDQAQNRPHDVPRQPSWEYNNQHKVVFNDKKPQGHDVYFHPGSENGHLEVRISEWKGKHCFYQGPDDYNQQEYNRAPRENDGADSRTQQRSELDEDRRRRDDWVRENSSERYERGSHRDLDEYDDRKRYNSRDHYDRKYDDYCDDREQQYYEGRRRRKYDHREHDGYKSENEDYREHKDAHAPRNKHRDDSYYYESDRDYYDSNRSNRYRERDSYQCREEDRYYDERKRKETRYDNREDDRCDRRDNISSNRDVDYRRGEETYRKERNHDSELDEPIGYKERPLYSKHKDRGDDRRDEHYDYGERDKYRAREPYERRARDRYDYEDEDRYESRERELSHHRSRDRFQDLRSLSVDSRYDEYPSKDRKTHCEEWVEEQNRKLALREMHSFEDPGVYRHCGEQERGYESSAGSSKQGRKPVYVGSLDRNSFYRKTAPSSLRKSQFATTRRQNKGKHGDVAIIPG